MSPSGCFLKNLHPDPAAAGPEVLRARAGHRKIRL